MDRRALIRTLPTLAIFGSFATTCGGLQVGVGASALAARDRELVRIDGVELELARIAGPLEHPWAIAFLPEGGALVTERPGRLRRIDPSGRLDPRPIEGVPEVWARGQGGLLDVALDPDFVTNRLVYLSYAAPIGRGAATRVARGRLDGQRLRDLEVILTCDPPGTGSRHFGSRLVFAPDGRLFVSTGDRGEMERAQKLDDLAGKIVRIERDGRIPPDNPFVGRPGARPEIWAMGIRNAQGLVLHPRTGELWEHEHGPRGGDEVNVIEKGANYGWPLVTHGVDYTGLPIGYGKTMPGIVDPLWVWVPSIAPSGMTFYDAEAVPAWKGSLFVGALAAQMLVRLELDGRRVIREHRLLQGEIGRIRDVRVGPDGALYLLDDSARGALWRLGPPATRS
ncbi:MAG: PQQ-dependent sugar dehydrogenase, partial [Geminicoccaceae bacterium]|nr:PQQ-dependent sugar dehydrogenase [Geminicoccaceae bacterium]MDW8341472.1 PQQ-dependent sugar dehydrogenase [Geminicoccaceae bacterium]